MGGWPPASRYRLSAPGATLTVSAPSGEGERTRGTGGWPLAPGVTTVSAEAPNRDRPRLSGQGVRTRGAGGWPPAQGVVVSQHPRPT